MGGLSTFVLITVLYLTSLFIDQEIYTMAENTGNNHRIGSVINRTQVQNPLTGNYVKRDTTTGRFMDQKTDGKPFKGVAQETDKRRS